MHLAVIIPEITKFPYTFFKKLGCRMISFCSSFEFFKGKNRQSLFLKKRYHNALFSLENDNTPEKALIQFYKIINILIVNNREAFDFEWGLLNEQGFSYGKLKTSAYSPY